MKYNSQTITLKVDSVQDMASTASQSVTRYNKEKTNLKAIALDLLVCNGYNHYFAGREIGEYNKYLWLVKRQEHLLQEMQELYSSSK